MVASLTLRFPRTEGRTPYESSYCVLRFTRGTGIDAPVKKSVKRKIRYYVESLPAADNGFPGHDNPPVRAGPAGTEKNSGKIVKLGFLDSREQNKI